MARKTQPTTTKKTAPKKPAPVPTKTLTQQEKEAALEAELAGEDELPAEPPPKKGAKTFPLVCRDAAGEYTLTFASASARTKAAKTIQVAMSRGPGARPRPIECLEGTVFFHVGGHFRIPSA